MDTSEKVQQADFILGIKGIGGMFPPWGEGGDEGRGMGRRYARTRGGEGRRGEGGGGAGGDDGAPPAPRRGEGGLMYLGVTLAKSTRSNPRYLIARALNTSVGYLAKSCAYWAQSEVQTDWAQIRRIRCPS